MVSHGYILGQHPARVPGKIAQFGSDVWRANTEVAAQLSRRHADDLPEALIERRQVLKAGCERDRGDRRSRIAQQPGRLPHARDANVGMRRGSHDATKTAQKVEWAHRRARREHGERMVRTGLDVDGSRHGEHCAYLRKRGRSLPRADAQRVGDPRNHVDRQCVCIDCALAIRQGFGSREMPRTTTQNGQRHPGKHSATRSVDERQHLVVTRGRELKRHAAIAGAMLVAAAEARLRIAEQHRSAAQIAAARAASIGERAGHNQRDGNVVVPLLEGMIRCIGIADDIPESPALTLENGRHRRAAASALQAPPLDCTMDDIV